MTALLTNVVRGPLVSACRSAVLSSDQHPLASDPPLMSHSEVMIMLHSHTAMQVTGPRSLPLGVDVTTDGSRFRHAHQAMYPPASDRRLGSEARNKLLLSSNLPSHG